jgi:hypothetical protein
VSWSTKEVGTRICHGLSSHTIIAIKRDSRWHHSKCYLVRMVGFEVDENLNMRLSEETKGHQVEYHQMGRVRVDKKIFRAPQW